MEWSKGQKNFFTKALIHWHETSNERSLPWKEEQDPYKIWLSEIILQQTRAQQGLPYYLRFTEAYPTVNDMAAAKDEEAFRLWQGLGYYNRCKNMLGTARYIANELDGKFPDTYEEIIKLKGIGPYTAAAIASFAFALPHAVVDGNVYRVLSRYFGIDTPFDTTEGKKIFQQLAQELLHKDDSAAYNQAIMDLGATVCMPQQPLCPECPLQKNCTAYKQQLTGMLPVRSKKTSVRKRYFHYILLHAKDKLWIHKRPAKDIWENLHEPYLIEAEEALKTDKLVKNAAYIFDNEKAGKPEYEGFLTQRLTHQLIETHFFSLQIGEIIKVPVDSGNWVAINELKNYAFPKTVVSFLEKKLYF